MCDDRKAICTGAKSKKKKIWLNRVWKRSSRKAKDEKILLVPRSLNRSLILLKNNSIGFLKAKTKTISIKYNGNHHFISGNIAEVMSLVCPAALNKPIVGREEK